MFKEHRILIHGGTIVDGNNTPGVRADVLIEDDEVVEVGLLDSLTDAEKINATGKIVASGFIDPHNHANSEVKGGTLEYPLAAKPNSIFLYTLICGQRARS